MPGDAKRLWRLRKRHQWVDAEIDVAGRDVCLRLLLNGQLTYERRWPTRDEALAEASGKRAELEQHGWAEHW